MENIEDINVKMEICNDALMDKATVCTHTDNQINEYEFAEGEDAPNSIVKNEITIEPEQITEAYVADDYLAANFIEPLVHITVHSNQDINENLSELNFITEKQECDLIYCSSDKCIENDLKLSEIMSDHNYTSQPKHSQEDLKKLLLSHLSMSDSSMQNIPTHLLNLIEKTVSSITQYRVGTKSALKSPNELQTNKSTESEIEKIEFTHMKTSCETLIDASNDNLPILTENSEINENVKNLKDHNNSKDTDIALPLTYSNHVLNLLPENCSESLKVLIKDSDNADIKNQNQMGACKAKEVLKKLIDFGKSLYNECNNFTSTITNVDEKINNYIKEQVLKFKTIVDAFVLVDKGIQTEKLLKKSKLSFKEKQAFIVKKQLMEDSTSDNIKYTDSDSTDQSNFTLNTNGFHSRTNFSKENLHPTDLKISQEFDDGIDLFKYIQSDIFEIEYRKPSTEARSESDKENRIKKRFSSEDDDTDKEIERLTNIGRLVKKQNQDHCKLSEIEKSKPKTVSQKIENDSIDCFEDDFNNNLSDENMSQNEEVITEEQYLARYNEEIKQQLLNDTSSNSSDFDEKSTDELEHNLINHYDENDCHSVVDTFLENFSVKELENDEQSNECQQNTKEFGKNSDELENNNFIYKKNAKPKKSLEEMLTETDKRINNNNEEIVLSSESDYSDVEAVDIEPAAEKSRIIKPMLRPDQLANETRKSQKLETERLRRLEKQQAALEKVLRKNNDSKESDLILDYFEETKTFIKVHPDIVKDLKPHQIDGVKFMYNSCYGGADLTKKFSGSGCILAHCMGLGKTLQLIALINTVVSYKELKTNKVLVLCPKSTVMNWAEEIHRWLFPLKNNKNIKVFAFAEPSDIKEKMNILEEWSSNENKAGCLLLGYEAFRTLVFYHSYKNRCNLSADKLQDIKEKIDKFLLKPGADLVVCDEGHVIKNSKSAISLAVAKINTPRRIILTGTPIQNNLKEYYSMVNFIKPLYLGTEKEFANLYANPIKNGQHKDSSKKDIKVMKQRSFVLHKKLSKFVQRKEAELLKSFLPPKFEYVLFIPMTSVQNNLYEYILDAISKRGDIRGKGLITDYTCLRKIWTHPKVLQDAWKNANIQKNKSDLRKNYQAPHSEDDQPDDIYDSQTGVMSVTNDWWRSLVTKKDLETILPSNKLRAMFEILRLCEERDEKCLIFSAFVAVLNVVEYFFAKITAKDFEILQQIYSQSSQKTSNSWISGQDYYRLDGKTPKAIRHEMIKRFNSATNKRTRVFLISSKAGGQGINLTGANRVIILDTSWNPSNDQQNIFRIFRLGQQKNCYIYRLIAMGTMEEKVYSRSVTKQAMSFRVVDEQQIDRHYNMAELAELYTLTKPNNAERPMPVLPKDNILASLLLNHPEIVFKYHEHDSLLENKVEQELSEQEKADAWAAYERELQMNFAQQDVAAAEQSHNQFPSLKMPNYIGQIPSLDMQALLNYSMLGAQTSSLMSPYSYPSHPQYLEAIYRNVALGLSDVNNPMQDNSFNSIYNSPNKHKSLASNYPLLNNLQGNMVNSGPTMLNALADMSMLCMNSHKNVLQNNTSTSSLQPSHIPNYPLPPMPLHTNVSNNNNKSNNNVLSSFGQYSTLMDNGLPNYLNYGLKDYHSANSLQNPNLLTGSNLNQHVMPSQFSSPNSVSNTNEFLKESLTSRPESANNHYTADNIHNQNFLSSRDKVDFNSSKRNEDAQHDDVRPSHNESNLLPTHPNHYIDPLISATGKSVSHHPGSYSSVLLAQNKMTNHMTLASTVDQVQNQKNVKPADKKNTSMGNINLDSAYLNVKDRTKSIPKDLLSSKSEMQIIPTTSPPGTVSISKQFNEMAPSISLTAVNNINSTQEQNAESAKLIRDTQQNLVRKNSTNSAISLSKIAKPVPATLSTISTSNNKSVYPSSNESKITMNDPPRLVFRESISKTSANSKALHLNTSNKNNVLKSMKNNSKQNAINTFPGALTPPGPYLKSQTLKTQISDNTININSKNASAMNIKSHNSNKDQISKLSNANTISDRKNIYSSPVKIRSNMCMSAPGTPSLSAGNKNATQLMKSSDESHSHTKRKGDTVTNFTDTKRQKIFFTP